MLGVGVGGEEEGRKRRRKEPGCTPRETSGTRVLRNSGTRLQQRDIFPQDSRLKGTREDERPLRSLSPGFWKLPAAEPQTGAAHRSSAPICPKIPSRKVARPALELAFGEARLRRSSRLRHAGPGEPPGPQPRTRRARLTFQLLYFSSPGRGVLLTSVDLLRCRDTGSALELRGPEGTVRATVRAGC